MNPKNPTGPVGMKSTKLGSRFSRVIPAPDYATFIRQSQENHEIFYKYDNQGRRTL